MIKNKGKSKKHHENEHDKEQDKVGEASYHKMNMIQNKEKQEKLQKN